MLENPLPKLIGDKRRLLQVLINLVKNSLKFTNKGSISIGVRYDEKQSLLEVAVNDTGVGIKPEEIKHLFQKFGKLHRTAEINSQGIGLGLLIVK